MSSLRMGYFAWIVVLCRPDSRLSSLRYSGFVAWIGRLGRGRSVIWSAKQGDLLFEVFALDRFSLGPRRGRLRGTVLRDVFIPARAWGGGW